jgi:hypothetical protein
MEAADIWKWDMWIPMEVDIWEVVDISGSVVREMDTHRMDKVWRSDVWDRVLAGQRPKL